MLCLVCNKEHDSLVHHFHGPLDEPLIELFGQVKPGWQPSDGVCKRCIDHAQVTQWEKTDPGIQQSPKQSVGDYWILPISKRLTAHPSYTGKGVTICFIDSGFHLHPDLTRTNNRILKMLDIHQPDIDVEQAWSGPHPHSWHGTMTSVVGAGDGFLSGGIYKSLAPDANLVLIKVMDKNGMITGEAIADALEWVLAHHEQYNIRVVNLSVTDDDAESYKASEIGQAVEQLVQAGVNIVAAVGNQSGDIVKAPANSPHALTIGGLDDANTLHPLTHSLYHSTYGATVDQTYKPELIAPAIWIPAPILPGTEAHSEAVALFTIKNADPEYRKSVAANLIQQTKLPPSVLEASPEEFDQQIEDRIKAAKLISPDYQHADGTSFAAPIVCGVIAQMLEANPALNPADVRDLLIRTARRLPGFPVSRQGYGVVHPLSAVYHAEHDHHDFPPYFSPVINYRDQTIKFHYHHEDAEGVEVLGSFNNWQDSNIGMEEKDHHLWAGSTPIFPDGKYHYKYRINGQEWKSDSRNLFREPDGFGGFNSLIILESEE